VGVTLAEIIGCLREFMPMQGPPLPRPSKHIRCITLSLFPACWLQKIFPTTLSAL